ncbi:MAG: hypothetical protein KJZ69_18670 [Phycisphaerales bacterium]|nr:hypothetical protein [Phycisphaerales bacterium]
MSQSANRRASRRRHVRSSVPRRSTMQFEPLEPRKLLSGLTIVTHGQQFLWYEPDWLEDLRDSVVDRIADEQSVSRRDIAVGVIEYDEASNRATLSPLDGFSESASGEIVLSLEWEMGDSTQDVARAVRGVLTSPIEVFGRMLALVELPIHLVGHSRGGSLVASLAHQLGELGIWVDQVTTLDLHPTLGDYGNGVFEDVMVTENVIFADGYWRSDGWLGQLDGEPFFGAYNRELDDSLLDGGWDGAHSDVHLWYHGSVDFLGPVVEGNESGSRGEPGGWAELTDPMRDTWYDNGPGRYENGGRDTGYRYARPTGFDRAGASAEVRRGLHEDFGGWRPANEQRAIYWGGATWANILSLDVEGGYSRRIGETLVFDYQYNDYDSESTVLLRLDDDLNPFNGHLAGLGSNQHSRTWERVATASSDWNTAGYSPGDYFVFAQITDAAGHTRYLYAPQQLSLWPPNQQNGSALRTEELDWFRTEDGDRITETGEWSMLDIDLINISGGTARDINGWLTADSSIVTDIRPGTNTWYTLGPGESGTDRDDWTVTVEGFETTTVTFTLHLTYWQGDTLYAQELQFEQTFHQQGVPAAVPHLHSWRWAENPNQGGHTYGDGVQSGEYGKLYVTLDNHGQVPINNLVIWLEKSDPQQRVDLEYYRDGGNTIRPGERIERSWPFHPYRDFAGDVPINVYMEWYVGNERFDNFSNPDSFTVHVETAAWLEIGSEDPDHRLDGNVVDFGVLAPDVIHQWTFYVENQGTEPLRLTGIELSDPLHVRWEDDGRPWEVPPASEYPNNRKYFTVFFDTDGVNLGQYESTIRVLSADGHGRFKNTYYEEDTVIMRALISVGTRIDDFPDTRNTETPDVSGDWIVWRESRNEQSDIFARRISDGQEVNVTNDAYGQSTPRISGSLIVWQDYRYWDGNPDYINTDLFGYDLDHPEHGIFGVSVDLQWRERLIGVDGGFVALQKDFHRFTEPRNARDTAANLVVLRYNGDGTFSQHYATDFRMGGQSFESIRGEQPYDGDFGSGLLVYEQFNWTWNSQYSEWNRTNYHVEVWDIAAQWATPRPVANWPYRGGYANLYSAAEHRFGFVSYDTEDDLQIFLWRNDQTITQITHSEFEPGDTVFAMGGSDGADFAVYNYARRSERPGLYYLTPVHPNHVEVQLSPDAYSEHLRMDGTAVVWSDNAYGGRIRYAFLGEPDLSVRSEDIAFSNHEPEQNEAFDVSVTVRNYSPFDLRRDVPLRLYDGAPEPGNLPIAEMMIRASDLPSMGSREYTFTDIRLDESGLHSLFIQVGAGGDHEYLGNNTASRDIYVFDDDTVGPRIENVEVLAYPDLNNNGFIDENEQIRLFWTMFDGSGIDPASIQVLLDGSPLAFSDLGNGEYEAVFGPLSARTYELEIRASDLDDTPATSVYRVEFKVVVPPEVGSLDGSPDPVRRGQPFVLTARDVTDRDGQVTQVEFYHDIDGNGILDVAVDTLLGTDVDPADGWTWNGVAGFSPGLNRFFARAQDDDGLWSEEATTTVFVYLNEAPTIGFLFASHSRIRPGRSLLLTAQDVVDPDGQITLVEFYRDQNGNGVLDVGIDALLGRDTMGSDGWTWTGAAAFPGGTNQFFARAKDNDEEWSRPANANVEVLPALHGGESRLEFVDGDGDVATVTLTGSSGTLWYTHGGQGQLAGLYVIGGEAQRGTLKATVRVVGDGRMSLSSLMALAADEVTEVAMSLWQIVMPAFDFVDGNIWLDQVSTATFGDLAGGSGVRGSVSRLSVGRVETSGVFDLDGELISLTAETLHLGGGLTAVSVGTIRVAAEADVRISTDRNASIALIQVQGEGASRIGLNVGSIERFDVFGDLTLSQGSVINGDAKIWRVRGSLLSGSLVIAGSTSKWRVDGDVGEECVITAESGGRFNVFADFAGHFDLGAPSRVDIRGTMVGGRLDVVTSEAVTTRLRVRGEMTGSSEINVTGDIRDIRIDGAIGVDAQVGVDGAVQRFTAGSDLAGRVIGESVDSLSVKGAMNGELDLGFLNKGVVRGDFTGSISADTETELAITRLDVKGIASGRIDAIGDVGDLLFGELRQLEVYLGLRNWIGGLPERFDRPQSVLGRLQVRGATTGATIAAPTISRLDLRDVLPEQVFHLAAIEVNSASLRIDGQQYRFEDDRFLENAPNVPWLDLVRLLN